MNRLRHLQYIMLLGFVLFIAGVLLAQRAPNKTLVVNGKDMDATMNRSVADLMWM